MKIGAYQFADTGDIQKNYQVIEHAARMACAERVRLLVFPECALTGYPPVNVKSCEAIDFPLLDGHIEKLKLLSSDCNLFIICGAVLKKNDRLYNSMPVFTPDGGMAETYYKRALWGWDKDQFVPGKTMGIYEIDGYRIGVRICFEVRFPEYFRELFKAKTDLNIVAFSDVNDQENLARYELIKAHLITRASENACPILSVNHTKPFQTAPTAFFDENGKTLCELERGIEKLLVTDYKPAEISFGVEGRRQISNQLLTQ